MNPTKRDEGTIMAYIRKKTEELTGYQDSRPLKPSIDLMCDFVKVLSRCKNLIIHKTFPARESYKKSGSAKTLCANLIKRGVNARYTTTFNEIEKHIENFKNLERIAIIGAGDLYFTARKTAEKIAKKPPRKPPA